MTRHLRPLAAFSVIAALALVAAFAVGRETGRADDLAAAVRAATLADVQARLALAAPVDHGPAWGAGMDAENPGADSRSAGGDVSAAENGGGDSRPPAWMPDTVLAWWGLIAPAAERHRVDPALVAIVVLVESAGNPAARSHAGASSLMQVMPLTGAEVAQRLGMGSAPDLFDPAVNVELGTAYLAECLGRFGRAADGADDWARSVELAAACFNGGPGGAARYRDGNPHSETRLYGELVLGMWRERGDPTSPTFDRWHTTWGKGAVDRARDVLVGMGILPPIAGGTMGATWRPRP